MQTKKTKQRNFQPVWGHTTWTNQVDKLLCCHICFSWQNSDSLLASPASVLCCLWSDCLCRLGVPRDSPPNLHGWLKRGSPWKVINYSWSGLCRCAGEYLSLCSLFHSGTAERFCGLSPWHEALGRTWKLVQLSTVGSEVKSQNRSHRAPPALHHFCAPSQLLWSLWQEAAPGGRVRQHWRGRGKQRSETEWALCGCGCHCPGVEGV